MCVVLLKPRTANLDQKVLAVFRGWKYLHRSTGAALQYNDDVELENSDVNLVNKLKRKRH